MIYLEEEIEDHYNGIWMEPLVATTVFAVFWSPCLGAGVV